jgi:hypothetical protein
MTGPLVRKVIVKAVKDPAAPSARRGYVAHFDGQDDPRGFGATPREAKRDLLLSLRVIETSGGASICVWTRGDYVKVWAHANEGASTSVALRPREVEAVIKQLHLGRKSL